MIRAIWVQYDRDTEAAETMDLEVQAAPDDGDGAPDLSRTIEVGLPEGRHAAVLPVHVGWGWAWIRARYRNEWMTHEWGDWERRRVREVADVELTVREDWERADA